MKLTMTTPGGQRTIELPRWIEDRILKLFISSVQAVPIGRTPETLLNKDGSGNNTGNAVKR